MTILPIATVIAMPSRMPRVACACVSSGSVKCINMQVYLEGYLANLWRRTRGRCRTTRHLDFSSRRVWRKARYREYESRIITKHEGSFETIRRVEEEEREAAKLIDTLSGANSDGLSTHMEA